MTDRINELRWLADHLEEHERGMDEYVNALRHSADTICSLRSKMMDDCRESARLKAENERLRELVGSVLTLRYEQSFEWLDETVAEVFGKSFTEQVRELGIEVDE